MRSVITALVGLVIGAVVTYGFLTWWQQENPELELPVLLAPSPSPKPLLQYSIPALQQRQFTARSIEVGEVVEDTEHFTSFIVTFSPLDKHMTALMTLPKPRPTSAPAVIMIRGYAPPENYTSGTGSRNSSRALATAGFVTIAPDFFGYGGSDPEPKDSWQARFEKPIIIAELLRTLQTTTIQLPDETITPLSFTKVGFWGHSNGGQIALTSLEILREPIPTVLWAPVTAPFPYSVLFFSDEHSDEGKEQRKWIAMFEENYDVFDFSLTRHLDALVAPLQVHHGTADQEALQVWSDEFIDKIQLENRRRAAEATMSATAQSEIDVEYFTYPGANHNLTPGWDLAMERTRNFFQEQLLTP